MLRWLLGRGASRRRVARTQASIAEDRWRKALAQLPFMRGLSPEEDAALRQRAAWVLASKSFSGAHGFEVTDDIMLSIALQAALPILWLDPVLYEGWTEIIVYPGGFLIPRSDIDESGVVHEYMQEASGEAWEGGPLILSWEDSRDVASRRANVVIHEFAHKLDLYAGQADGMPGLHAHPGMRPAQWRRVLHDAFDRFNLALNRIEDAIPPDVDPESDDASPWFDALPMDAYAATDEAEFFAVSSEAFFIDPLPLQAALPEWYELLRQYYRQDPAQRLGG
ncbi:MAG TPA: M90 family metallopeptidase [Burkholderiaceae bacterium]|nr:M90 family metallopeptidase [Burkholderiaceae bacterium]